MDVFKPKIERVVQDIITTRDDFEESFNDFKSIS